MFEIRNRIRAPCDIVFTAWEGLCVTLDDLPTRNTGLCCKAVGKKGHFKNRVKWSDRDNSARPVRMEPKP